MSGILAAWRAQRVDWARRGMWRFDRQSPDGKQALLHRLDEGRQAHHARCLRPPHAGVARTWRQESLDRLPRCKRGLGYRWNYCGNALHPAEPVLHRGLSPLAHRDIFDSFLNALGQKVKALKLGDPLDETSDIGTIINEKQF